MLYWLEEDRAGRADGEMRTETETVYDDDTSSFAEKKKRKRRSNKSLLNHLGLSYNR